MKPLLLAPALALIALGGCATVPAAADNLTGTRWAIVSINGAAPKSPRAGIEFNPDRISATVGCNGMGGSWAAKDGQLLTGPFVSTMMFCDGLMEQERAVGQLFEARPSYSITDGRMTLQGGGHRLELRRTN